MVETRYLMTFSYQKHYTYCKMGLALLGESAFSEILSVSWQQVTANASVKFLADADGPIDFWN